MPDVIAYIDGFNLYNGLRARYQRKYLWLDLEQMCRSLLLPGQSLVRVNYFTAAVRDRPDPTSTVVAAFPPKRTSGDLASVVDAHFTIAERKLSASLLPNQVPGTKQTFGRPGSWY